FPNSISIHSPTQPHALDCFPAVLKSAFPPVIGLIDTQSASHMIGAMPEQRETRGASRYDAVIATLVGFLALCVSGYTAYMQRQQVRAAVWPILEFYSS